MGENARLLENIIVQIVPTYKFACLVLLNSTVWYTTLMSLHSAPLQH